MAFSDPEMRVGAIELPDGRVNGRTLQEVDGDGPPGPVLLHKG